MIHTSTIAAARPAPRTRNSLTHAGRAVIAVLLLVVFEGAIRKWVAPASTGPLILLRDLLVLYVIFSALRRGTLRRSPRLTKAMVLWSACVVGWGLLQVTLGENTFTVFLIGLRFWLLYFWFAVAAASLMTEHDYVTAVRVLMLTLVVMTPLVVLQHNAPPTSFLNSTPDTDVEDIFVVVEGVVRTTGTFTFTAGFVFFLAICTPLAMGMIEARKRHVRQFLYALIVFACAAAGAMVSGARSAVLFFGAILAMYVAGNLVFAPARKKGRAIAVAVLVLLAMGGMALIFSDAVTATQERFANAGQSEDLTARILTTFFGESWIADRAGVVGAGIGVGSNLAQFVKAGARTVFALAETESGRTLLEGGLVGWLFIIAKFAVVLMGMLAGFTLAVRTRTVYPLLIWASVSVALITWPVIGQISANGLFGLLLLFGLLCTRYPRLQVFG